MFKKITKLKRERKIKEILLFIYYYKIIYDLLYALNCVFEFCVYIIRFPYLLLANLLLYKKRLTFALLITYLKSCTLLLKTCIREVILIIIYATGICVSCNRRPLYKSTFNIICIYITSI